MNCKHCGKPIDWSGHIHFNPVANAACAVPAMIQVYELPANGAAVTVIPNVDLRTNVAAGCAAANYISLDLEAWQ